MREICSVSKLKTLSWDLQTEGRGKCNSCENLSSLMVDGEEFACERLRGEVLQLFHTLTFNSCA